MEFGTDFTIAYILLHIKFQLLHCNENNWSSSAASDTKQNNVCHRVFEKYAPSADATFIKEKEHGVCAKTWFRFSYL